MTKSTSTERSRRSRAAATLGLVWVQGYVKQWVSYRIEADFLNADDAIREEMDDKKNAGGN